MSRIGLIGCGNWGRNILRDLVGLGAEVHVVAPSEASRANAAAGGATAVTERIDDLAALDGYVVASPSTTHAAAIDALIPTGRPIFVEKPMTTNVDDARRLVRLAGERIFVMDKWRYHRGIEAIAELAKSGGLGDVRAIRSCRLGFGNPHHDADATWVLLPHDLSIAYEILGYLPAATAAFGLAPGAAGDGLIGVLSDGDGPQVTMEIGASHPVNRRSVLVVGTMRAVELAGSYDEKLIIGDLASGTREERAIETDLPLWRELQAFLEHLRGGPPPRSSAAEGLLVVERIAALRRLAGLD